MVKKPNLSTVEQRLDSKDVYVMPNGSVIRLSKGGHFTLNKNGSTKIYFTLRSAWLDA